MNPWKVKISVSDQVRVPQEAEDLLLELFGKRAGKATSFIKDVAFAGVDWKALIIGLKAQIDNRDELELLARIRTGKTAEQLAKFLDLSLGHVEEQLARLDAPYADAGAKE